MECKYCKNIIDLYRERILGSEFCSDQCELDYEKEQNDMWTRKLHKKISPEEYSYLK